MLYNIQSAGRGDKSICNILTSHLSSVRHDTSGRSSDFLTPSQQIELLHTETETPWNFKTSFNILLCDAILWCISPLCPSAFLVTGTWKSDEDWTVDKCTFLLLFNHLVEKTLFIILDHYRNPSIRKFCIKGEIGGGVNSRECSFENALKKRNVVNNLRVRAYCDKSVTRTN